MLACASSSICAKRNIFPIFTTPRADSIQMTEESTLYVAYYFSYLDRAHHLILPASFILVLNLATPHVLLPTILLFLLAALLLSNKSFQRSSFSVECSLYHCPGSESLSVFRRGLLSSVLGQNLLILYLLSSFVSHLRSTDLLFYYYLYCSINLLFHHC